MFSVISVIREVEVLEFFFTIKLEKRRVFEKDTKNLALKKGNREMN